MLIANLGHGAVPHCLVGHILLPRLRSTARLLNFCRRARCTLTVYIGHDNGGTFTRQLVRYRMAQPWVRCAARYQTDLAVYHSHVYPLVTLFTASHGRKARGSCS